MNGPVTHVRAIDAEDERGDHGGNGAEQRGQTLMEFLEGYEAEGDHQQQPNHHHRQDGLRLSSRRAGHGHSGGGEGRGNQHDRPG